MDFREISAKTVDDAITKACIEMEASSGNLDIQVVSEGSSGFLGFGCKPAIIKVRRKVVVEELEQVIRKPEKKEFSKGPKKAPRETFKEPKKEFKKEFKSEKKVPDRTPKSLESTASEERKLEAPVIRTAEEITAIKAESQKFLGDVFSAMDIKAEVTTEYDNENSNLNIDFTGEDMGVLIGKRGQTLDSLQYLTSLVVNKGRDGYIRVKLDTENYRNRRKDTLENLARNIAFKVKKTRKSVSLEPMNPYERRIIHSSLQGNKNVETFSEGNEPYRHVVVALRK